MARDWAPFTLSWDDNVPIDLSFVFEHEKPAGKHGFLTAWDSNFVFEDGAPGRFWGTNFNSGANFPPHDYSEMVARRLAKFGVNIMRTHQMDSEWATPNIFTSNRDKPDDNTRHLDPTSMDRLDYLFSCLKKEGVYIYLDMLTYRQFLPGDAVDSYEQLPQAAKPYLYFDRRLIELQKEFNEQLWTHVNPYTGLAYKDEPAIAMAELVNEADFFANPPVVEPYRTRLEATYRAWAAGQDLTVPAGDVDFRKPDEQMAEFFIDVMKDYYDEMVDHLRKIGVKIPLTGTNWSINLGVTAAQSEMDFMDSHVYWNYPWTDPAGTITHWPMVSSQRNDFASLSLMRRLDKPFFVSEWDHCYPAEYRAESSLALAAVTAFQGWGGCTIHTYRYSTWEPENRIAGGSSAINGIVYRNFFDSFNDPAKFGLFYHAALIVRRGDVQPGDATLALQVDDAQPWRLKRFDQLPALTATPEQVRMGLVLPGDPAPADRIVPAEQELIAEDAGEVRSPDGQLYRSWKQRIGWVNTPRTKVAYGFLADAGKLSLDGVELEIKTDYAVVALSSLTDDDIEDAPSMLLTAVGRSENTDVKLSEDGKRMLDAGRHPMLIEPIEGKVRIKTSRPNLKVFVITDHAELARRLPVKYEDGCLTFDIGRQPDWIPSTMYYLIRI
jgi:hypothetical protein